MIDNNEDKKEEARVMDAIKRGNLQMRPRWYFAVRAGLVIFSVVFLLLLLIYVVSFIIFALHEDGAWFAPGFGPSGWTLFLTALPWTMFIISIVLLLSLANILKRYAFVYHQPIFIFLIAFILLVTVAGFLLAATPFHAGLSQYAARNIPVLESFYEGETAMPASIHRGEIVAISDGGLVLKNGVGMTSTVIAAPGVVFPGDFHVGDIVLVFGTEQNEDTIKAFGIQRIAAIVVVPITTSTVSSTSAN